MKKILLIALIIISLLFTAGCEMLEQRQAAPASSPPVSSAPAGDSGNSPASPPDGRLSSAPAPAFTPPPARPTLTLMIPEGFTLARIGMELEEMGLFTAAEFIDTAQNGDFSEFSLVAAQNFNPNRCFTLEGYLFPDTYEIYADDPPEAVIRRMLANLERRINDDLRREIAESGYTFDEILTIASIIEKEALGVDVRLLVSSVIHNRLNIRMMLQMCYTDIYVRHVIEPFVDGGIERFNEFYNTYRAAALPPGAICNPGLAAIRAALNPADTAYFFFISDPEDNFHFAAGWDQHVANVQRYLQ
jgi:UPF0755 protein